MIGMYAAAIHFMYQSFYPPYNSEHRPRDGHAAAPPSELGRRLAERPRPRQPGLRARQAQLGQHLRGVRPEGGRRALQRDMCQAGPKDASWPVCIPVG
jgi:hypothetical protein